MATVAKVRLVSNIFRGALSKGSFDIYQYWLWITIILLSPPESKSTFSSTLNTWPPEGWTSFTRFGYTCRIACFGNGRWGWVTSSGGRLWGSGWGNSPGPDSEGWGGDWPRGTSWLRSSSIEESSSGSRNSVVVGSWKSGSMGSYSSSSVSV